jgi:predicted nucleic acid-binding protein
MNAPCFLDTNTILLYSISRDPADTPKRNTAIAVGLIPTWLRFKVQEITLPVMTGALEVKANYGLSYWDAAIIAAARALGCRELVTEDMSHGRDIEGVTLTNPFR